MKRSLGLPRWLFAAHVAWAGGGGHWLALLGLWPGLPPLRFFCAPVRLSSCWGCCWCVGCLRALPLRSSRFLSVSVPCSRVLLFGFTLFGVSFGARKFLFGSYFPREFLHMFFSLLARCSDLFDGSFELWHNFIPSMSSAVCLVMQ